MQLDAFLENMTPTIHQILRQALELGKWPDGRPMTNDERDASLQAVIVYEHQHVPEAERIGYMPATCKSAGGQSSVKEEPASILRFQDA